MHSPHSSLCLSLPPIPSFPHHSLPCLQHTLTPVPSTAPPALRAATCAPTTVPLSPTRSPLSTTHPPVSPTHFHGFSLCNHSHLCSRAITLHASPLGPKACLTWALEVRHRGLGRMSETPPDRCCICWRWESGPQMSVVESTDFFF